MTPLFNLLCSLKNWSFLSSTEDVPPQVPVSLFSSSAKATTVLPGSFAFPHCPLPHRVLSLAPKMAMKRTWLTSNTSQTMLNNGGWDHCELTSTSEQSIVWVQLPGQGPQAPWIPDYNIVQVHLLTFTSLLLCVCVCVCVSGQRHGNMKNPTTCRGEKGWSNELLGWRGKPEEH